MRIRRKINIRVEVIPSVWKETEENMLAACKHLVEDIKRHVDNNGVSVAYETEEICSLCKMIWEVDEQSVPFCCAPAQAEYCSANNLKYDEATDKFVPIGASHEEK